MNIQDLHDLIKDNDKKRREDHKEIMSRLDTYSKAFVRWRVFVLIIPLILGAYGFAWAYGNYVMEKLLNHLIGG